LTCLISGVYNSFRNKIPSQQAPRRRLRRAGNAIDCNQSKHGLRYILHHLCLLGILLSVLCSNRALAQVDQGTITGLVQDSTGSVTDELVTADGEDAEAANIADGDPDAEGVLLIAAGVTDEIQPLMAL
jgi:hypothetical protein